MFAIVEYRLPITTSNTKKGGTDSRVSINLISKNPAPDSETPTSGEKHLDNEEDNLKKGKVDEFTIGFKDIGELEFIHLRHDNSRRYPGWNVKRVDVHNARSEATWYADDVGWLALTELTKVISKTIPVIKLPN